jgi:hypothetical protein
MKTLKDTVTLAALILLALTVRVNSQDASTIDVVTPVQAAVGQSAAQELEPEPAPAPEIAEVLEQVAFVLPDLAAGSREIERHLVWEVGGKRVVIVFDKEPQVEPPSPAKVPALPDTSACSVHRARLSC